MRHALLILFLLSSPALSEPSYSGQAFEACMQKNCKKHRGNSTKWGKCYEKKCAGTSDTSSPLGPVGMGDDELAFLPMEGDEVQWGAFPPPSGYIPMPGGFDFE